MKIEFRDTVVEGDVVKATATLVLAVSELEEITYKNRFSSGQSLADTICNQIASEVAAAYLKENKVALVDAVDLKKITDAIQLKIVEGFSLNSR